MPESHLKQTGFTYSACDPFTKNKDRIEKSMQTWNTDFINRSKPDKACLPHDIAYGKSEDLAKRTQSVKVLRDKAFKIAINPKYDGYQRGLTSMVYKFFNKNLVEMVLTLRLQISLLLNQIINLQMNFTGRLFENLRDKKFIHLSEAIFGVWI